MENGAGEQVGAQMNAVSKREHLWSTGWWNVQAVHSNCAGQWLFQWRDLLSSSVEQVTVNYRRFCCVVATAGPCFFSRSQLSLHLSALPFRVG